MTAADEARAALRRGVAAARKGDLVGALEHYAEALAIEPRQRAARANRASALLHLGRCEDAVDECSAGLEQEEQAELYLVRGMALARLGREEARDDLIRHVELDPASRFKVRVWRVLRELDRTGAFARPAARVGSTC